MARPSAMPTPAVPRRWWAARSPSRPNSMCCWSGPRPWPPELPIRAIRNEGRARHKALMNGEGARMPTKKLPKVAYFCMEYALDSPFKIYAGGLGILAGDYLKGVKDHGYPMVGIGIRW